MHADSPNSSGTANRSTHIGPGRAIVVDGRRLAARGRRAGRRPRDAARPVGRQPPRCIWPSLSDDGRRSSSSASPVPTDAFLRSAHCIRRRSGWSARSAISTASSRRARPIRGPGSTTAAGACAIRSARQSRRRATPTAYAFLPRRRREPAPDPGRPGPCRHHRARPFPLHRQWRDRGRGWRSGSAMSTRASKRLMAGATLDARGAARRPHLRRQHGRLCVSPSRARSKRRSASTPPPRAVWLRALMAELERLANHLGDIGAICNDAAFALMHAHCGVLRERVLRAAEACFGHRLMMDRIVPGGVAVDLDAARHRRYLRASCATIGRRFPRLVELYDNTASLQDRTVGTGIVPPSWRANSAPAAMSAAPPAAPSMRARRSGYAPYDQLDFDVPVLDDGDVNARVWIRIREVEQSLALIEQILDRLPHGPDRGRRSRPATRRGRWPRRRISAATCSSGCALDGRRGRALPSARSVLVPMAAAGSRDRGQHRRRLSALQQILQLLLFGARSLGATMRRTLFESLMRGPLTEPRHRPDDAALAELAASVDRGSAARLGRSLAIRAGRCRLLQRLRAGNPRAQQRVLRSRTVRPALRRLAAPRRRAHW